MKVALVRWILLVGLVGYGIYMALWAYQDAMLSVAADEIGKALYETRAVVFFPMAVLLISNGILFFLVLKSKERRTEAKPDEDTHSSVP